MHTFLSGPTTEPITSETIEHHRLDARRLRAEMRRRRRVRKIVR